MNLLIFTLELWFKRSRGKNNNNNDNKDKQNNTTQI